MILVVIFLYLELGPSALAGVAFLLLLVPVNLYSSKKIEECQSSILESKDERMKLTNETLLGILAIKLCAWEPHFARRIRSLREREVGLLRRMAKMFAFSQCTFTCSPIFVSLVVFAVYIAVDPVGHVLTPEKVFVSISLFSILRLPLELFPIFVFDLVRTSVSLGRISRLLNCQELDPGAVEEGDSGEAVAVEVEGGSFGWSKEEERKEDLKDIEVRIGRGEMVMVVGKVGSGKSTLLSGLLGDAVRLGGRARVSGSVAYVPQQAWVLNATLRDNVLFGAEEGGVRYGRVLSACGMNEDLGVLPAGDETEIGEEGVTLSGGQRQRVSLARAAFADRDIYLLDDPLSAVDAHVGSHIFERLIAGRRAILRDKTRILVTHGLQYLERADRILVLEEGRLVEQVRK